MSGYKTVGLSRQQQEALLFCIDGLSAHLNETGFLNLGDSDVTLLDYLRQQLAYNDWANREVLTAIRSQGADSTSLRYMAHILSAERLWLERMKQKPQSMSVWPQPDLEQCETQAAEMRTLWSEHFDALSEDSLTQSISYKNSKGEPWSSTVRDILTHVFMHSAYHRGQIASHMRASGHQPAYTDFIHAVRQGCVT